MTDIAQPSVNQTPPEDITHFRGELWALFKLGSPMALAQLAQMATLSVDVIMIARLSPEDLAASSLGLVAYFAFWMIGFGPAMAVSPMAAQALGKNPDDYTDVRRTVRASLWLIAIMSPFVYLISWHTGAVLTFLGQDPQLSEKAGHYVRAIMLGWPLSLGIMALRNYLAVLGKTTIPLWIILATIAVNAALNWLFIFGALGFPRLELLGAGLASSLATLICFAGFTVYAYWDKASRRFEIFKDVFKFDEPRLKEMFRLGWPISLSGFFEGMLFNAGVLLIGLIGVLEVAAYQIAINVASLAYMLPWGLSMAGAARMGLAMGAGSKPAMMRVSLANFILAVGAISLIAIPVWLWPSEIAMLYMSEATPAAQSVRALVQSFLLIAGGFMLFDALQVTTNQLLRGMKDVNWPMILTCVSYWLVGFPTAYYLGLHTQLGANGVWYGLMAGLAAAALLLGLRLKVMLAKVILENPKPNAPL